MFRLVSFKKTFCILLLLLFFLFPSKIFFANSTKDSLLLALQQASSQEEKILTKIKLSEAYINIDNDSSLIVGIYALQQAKSISFAKGFEESILLVLKIRETRKEYDEVIEHCQMGLDYFKKKEHQEGIVKMYHGIGNAYHLKNEFKKALIYFEKALKICKKNDFEALLASSYYFIGLVEERLGNYDRAIEFSLLAHKYYEATENFQMASNSCLSLGNIKGLQNDYTEALNYYLKGLKILETHKIEAKVSSFFYNIAILHNSQGQYEKALEYFSKSINYSKEHNDNLDVMYLYSLTGIGITYCETGDIKKAKEYAFRGLEYAKKVKDKIQIGVSLNTIGDAFKAEKNYVKALEYYEKSLNQCKKIAFLLGIAGNYSAIGNIYYLNKDSKLAQENLFQAINIYEKIGYKSGIVDANLILAKLSFEKDQADKAILYGEKAFKLANENNIFKKKLEVAEILTMSYKQKNNFSKALEYAEIYKATNDTLFNIEKNKIFNQYSFQFDTELKEAKLAKQQLEIEQNINQRNQIIIISLIFISLLIGGAQWYYTRLRSQKQRVDLALITKEKETVQLKEIDQLKTRFYANISHEFRTPLTLIISPLKDMIAGTFKGDFYRQYKVMLRNSERLLNLINQLLDLSKLAAKKMQLEATEVNFNDWIAIIYNFFHSLAVRKEIKYDLILPKESIKCWVDLDKMEKILTNLIYNAFKFTNPGDSIILTVTKGDNNQLIIEVKDTGIGIAEEELPHVFNQFYQADNSNTKNIQGTGIGLALVKELINLHYGDVSVTSQLTKETTFTLCIPLGNQHLKEIEMLAKAEAPKMVTNPIIRQSQKENEEIVIKETFIPKINIEDKIILIVEDNNDLRAYIKSSLKEEYKIIEANNGRDGLEKALQIIPDLIITDVMMPIMDGKEMSQKLKKHISTSHIPIIMLTALAGIKDRLEGLQMGVDNYLSKPFSRKELRIRIKNLIAQRNLLKEKYSHSITYSPPKNKDSKGSLLASNNKRSEETKNNHLNQEDKFLQQILTIVEINMEDENFGVEELSKAVFLSRFQVHRKLKALTGQSISVFIRSIKLKNAKRLLENKEGNVSEVAFKLGFNSVAYFSKCFSEEFGFSPSKVVPIT